MPAYERVVWKSDVLEHNIEAMLRAMADCATAQFCSEVRAIASAPGPLHAKLARLSKDIPGDPAAAFYGKLIGSAGSHFSESNAEDLISVLSAFFTCDNGIEPLRRGAETLGWDDLANLLQLAPEAVSELIETLWLTGLLRLGGLSGWFPGVEALKSAAGRGVCPRGAYQYVSAEAVNRIARFPELAWGLPRPPARWNTERIKLWQNAVVMAKHHHPDPDQGPLDSQRVFRHLLAYVGQGGKWPLDCEANRKFEEDHEEVARFKAAAPVCEIRDVLGGTVTVRFHSDPLEILSIDNVFSTCLRLGGESTAKVLGYATNVNVRVITVSGEDERILATGAIGLSLKEPVGVVQSDTYPGGNPELKRSIDDFVDDFLARSGLDSVPCGKVKNVCAEAYSL